MNIAVTDASIFIDLLECNASEAFFRLPYRILTSYQVWMELDTSHREILKGWVDRGQLTVLKIQEDFVRILQPFDLSTSLSIADRSVWFIANNKSAVLLTSDAVLRKMGKQHGIETHGLLWIFELMVDEQVLKPDVAVSCLEQIFDQNLYYSRNQRLVQAFNRLKQKWEVS